MADTNGFPARGRVRQAEGNQVVFLPSGTNYELHLKTTTSSYDGPIDQPVHATIRMTARKLWTVPSGGNFIAPIFGPPKIVQGRVRQINGQRIVVHAGTNFIIDLPAADAAIDLANGVIEVGSLVNVTGNGATFSLQPAPASA